MSSNTFYVQAGPSPQNPDMAACHYYSDYACTQEVQEPLRIPKDAGEVVFVLVPYAAAANPSKVSNQWLMVGSVADRVDTAAIDPIMTPATGNTVRIPMPKEKTVKQGVILLFSSQGPTTQLYASDDPTVINEGQ
ncbi:hypothetical protein ACG0Z6_00150 [Roseateles sp. BYS180W]|uniref:Uncharacterized protein n=1 Tax=Roseateles rivi TaxID=3299028 RepID=A0ABW7FQT0_9BURK